MKKQEKNAKDKDDKKKPNIKDTASILKTPNNREIIPIVKEDEILDFNSNYIKESLIFAKPYDIFPEWPNEQELKNFNAQMLDESLEPFIDEDNHKIKFPVSLENSLNNNFKWLRPNEFVRNFLIQKEIKTNFPHRQVGKMKQEIKDYYYSVELLLRKINDCQKNNKFLLKKDFYSDNNIHSISSQAYLDNEEIEKQRDNEYFNNENLEDYREFVLDSVSSDTLNNFNEYNTNAFNTEIHSIKQNKITDKNIIIYEGRESFNVKRDIYKSFFKFFESQQKYKIVNISERNESEEEVKKRLEEEAKADNSKDRNSKSNSILNNKSDKNFQNINSLGNEFDNNVNNSNNKIKEIFQSNLYLHSNPKPPVFTKWITSILQLILDLHLTDANTNRNILFNIYPQKDNFPVVSPSGRYWIKLYFMGKPRKIEIDDRIPCNSSEDFILPRCESIDEIWPGLITKALLKLYSYKFKHGTYNELADLSFIYSILGLYVEKIPMNSYRIKYMDNYFIENKHEQNSNLKITTFACMNFSEEDLSNNYMLPNVNIQCKKNFNFNFRILDPDKDMLDTSMARFSVKSKVTNHQDSIIKQPSKPKISSLISKIFNKKTQINTGKPVFKSLGDVFLRRGTNSDVINIPEKIEKEDAKELNIDESVINFNIDHKYKKNDTIDSDNLLANINIINQNISNIQNQTNNHPTFLAYKTEDQIIENENEGSILLKKNRQEKTSEKYLDLVKKLKSVNKIHKFIKTNSSKMLKIIDISNSKAEFKLDENNIKQDSKPDGLIKSIARTNKNLKSTLNMLKFDDVIANNEALKRNDILHNFVYSILEFFDNKKYNMDRLRPLDFSDLKKVVKDAQPQGMYKRLTVAEKKKYLVNLLEMKNKQIEIKNKRIEEIKKDGKQLFFIKIKNDCFGIPKFDFYIPFGDYDIYMSKKCILNNWFLPPPSYYLERFPKLEEEKTDELMSPQNILIESNKNEEKKKKKQSNKRILLSNIEENVESHYNNESHSNSPNSRNNASELYFNKSSSKKKKNQPNIETMHQLLGDHTDYSLSHKEPVSNFSGGSWINYNDFKKYFNSCLFFYDEKKFRNVLNLDNNWIYNYDCYEFNYDFSIIYLHTDNSIQQLINDENYHFSTLIVFEPNNGITGRPIDTTYYINFDVIDSSTGKTVQDTIHLNNFYSNIYLENLAKNKNYFLVVKSYLCPFGFNLKIMSDFNMDFINYNNYLRKFANYQSQKFNLEHLNIEKNKNYLLAKFSLGVFERTRFKILINHTDSLAKNCIEIFLLYGKSCFKTRKIGFNNLEIFTIDPIEDDLHYFVFLINPPYNIEKNNFEIEFMYNIDKFKLETLEYIEPYRIIDKITVNKYGVIFKEQITCLETVFATLEISLKNLIDDTNKNMKEDEIITEQNDYNQLLNPIEKSKLINKGPESIKEKIRMKVKILKNNETLLEEDFYNSILIKNFIFENPYSEVLMQSQDQKNNKNQNQQISLPNRELYTYYIICSFDLSEFDMNKSLIIKNNLYWEIRVFSSESLNFSKDTSKEDREKAVKDSWENSERGRSELAKTSRLRFLGISKKNRGEILGQDEEKIINTVRVKKITQSYDNFANFEKMNNADAKRKSTTINDLKIKSPSNAIQKGKTILSPEPVVNEYAKYEKLELRPIKIRADEHRSFYIRNFINYSTKERTITKGQHVAQSQRIILNDELRKRKIEQIDKNFYNFEYVKKTENDETLKTSNNPETLKLFYKTTSSFRQQSREGNFNLLRQRDFLRGKMERIIDFERNINDILLGNNNDIYYMATIYSESLSVEGLNNNLKMNLFKFISNKKNEFYNNEINKLTAKDKNTIMKHIDDIRISNFDLDQGLIVKFETLLNEPIKKKK